MKKTLSGAGALFLAFSISACTTDNGSESGSASGVSVTRVHLGQEIARGEIRVEPADPARANSPEFVRIASSVERELTRLGWTVARGNARSEQVALVRVEQGSREVMGARGVGATTPSSARPGDILVTALGVRIQRRSDATVAWEGRAELEARAGTALTEPAAAADRLAAALFQGFPGESGRTIRVR